MQHLTTDRRPAPRDARVSRDARAPGGAGRSLAAARALARVVALAMIVAHASPFAALADDGFLDGPDVVPVNPDFRPEIPFQGDSGTGFLTDVPLFSVSPQVVTTLGAALSASISAGSRPSVLTPYSGLVSSKAGLRQDSFGSLSTNKAATIGRGNFGLGFSYQHQKFRDYGDQSLGDYLSDEQRIDAPFDPRIDSEALAAIAVPPGYVMNVYPVIVNPDGSFALDPDGAVTVNSSLRLRDVEITADVVTLSLTYGLLDRLDVGVLAPYIFLNSKGKADLSVRSDDQNAIAIVGPDADGDGFADSTVYTDILSLSAGEEFSGSWDRDYEGFGDVVLFAKFLILSQQGVVGNPAPFDLAVQFEVKTPTGNEDDFLGTGEWDFAGRLVGQYEILENVLRARGEIGFNRSGLGADYSTFEYKLGAEYVPFDRVDLAFSAEAIGRESNLFSSQVDGVVGTKYSPGKQFPALRRMAVFAGLRFPFTRNGLGYAPSPILGAEYTFERPIERLLGEETEAPEAPAEGLDDFVPLDDGSTPASGSTDAPDAGDVAPGLDDFVPLEPLEESTSRDLPARGDAARRLLAAPAASVPLPEAGPFPWGSTVAATVAAARTE